MHVTQTYLGTYGDSGLFVYYLFEDYDDAQQKLTERVQNALDDLGADYMKEIDLFRPNERFAGHIAQEVREIRPLWEFCHNQLPGFLVSYKPLVQIDTKNDAVVFFSIKGRSEDDALKVIKRIRGLTREMIHLPTTEDSDVEERKSFGRRVFKALELKPGFAGVSIDLKKLLYWQ